MSDYSDLESNPDVWAKELIWNLSIVHKDANSWHKQIVEFYKAVRKDTLTKCARRIQAMANAKT